MVGTGFVRLPTVGDTNISETEVKNVQNFALFSWLNEFSSQRALEISNSDKPAKSFASKRKQVY